MINYVCREIMYVTVRNSLHCDLMSSHLEIIVQVQVAVRLFCSRMMVSAEHKAGWHSCYLHAAAPRACVAPLSTPTALRHSGTAEMEAVPENTRAFYINKMNLLFHSDYEIAIRYGSLVLGGQIRLLSFLHKVELFENQIIET